MTLTRIWSAELAATRGIELPVRPLCRQLLATGELDLPEDLPMVLEAESGFHFRRRGNRPVLAMADSKPRWGFDEVVDETLFDDRLARLQHRYAPAAGTAIEDAWAGLYDMTPDAHPILGEVADVALHTARDIEGVRRNESDSHATPSFACSRARTSSAHSGCSMCQSAGCLAISRSNTLAMAWVVVPV